MSEPNEYQQFNEITQSDDWRLYWDLQALQSTFRLHQGNYRELARLVAIPTNPEKNVKMWDTNNRESFNFVLIELERLLHNFLASANTLVDHTRRHIERFYGGTDFEFEFKAEISKRFAENNLRQFVQDLRNYSLHYALANVSATLSGLPAGTPHTHFTLWVDDLLQWPNWSTGARAFLRASEPEIDIASFIDEYMELIDGFYQWMRDRESAIHSARFLSLQRRLDAVPRRPSDGEN